MLDNGCQWLAFSELQQAARLVGEQQHRGTARLHLAYAGVRHAFTTRNAHVEDASVQVDLIDGPFSLLEGHWHFNPLAMPGDNESQACRIEFEMRYAFSSVPLEAVLSPVFDVSLTRSCSNPNSMMVWPSFTNACCCRLCEQLGTGEQAMRSVRGDYQRFLARLDRR